MSSVARALRAGPVDAAPVRHGLSVIRPGQGYPLTLGPVFQDAP